MMARFLTLPARKWALGKGSAGGFLRGLLCVGALLPAPALAASRIVSLAPHVTEMLFAIGAGDRIVGAVSYSDYPEKAKEIPRVGGYDRPDLERIVALKPDLIVAWSSGNPPGHLEKLSALGIPVERTEPKRLDHIPDTLEHLGDLTGQGEEARQVAADFRTTVAKLRQAQAGKPLLTVFYQVWHRPLMTVGGNHLISDVIRLCGGENIFSAITLPAAQVEREAVIAGDPQVIIVSGMGEPQPQWLDEWRPWKNMTAVRENALFHIHPDIIQRHGPRILEGARQICAALEHVRNSRPAGHDADTGRHSP